MNYKILVFSLLAFSVVANASDLIASAGRDYKAMSDIGFYRANWGDWHYEMKKNSDDSTLPMTYRIPPVNFWTVDSSSGDGLVTNRSGLFLAEEGVSLVADAKPFAPFYNVSVNWTSNYTGKINITGWYQRSTVTSNYHYNFSLWKNGAINFSAKVGIAGGDVNYSYGAYQMDSLPGDNFSVVIAAVNQSTPDVYLNFTMFITASVGSPTAPTRTVSVDKLNYTESEDVNISASLINVPDDTNITSNFSIKYANGSVAWVLSTNNVTDQTIALLTKKINSGTVFTTAALNETIEINVSTNLSLANGSWINFNNISTSRLHKITLQSCRGVYSTSPSAITFTTFNEENGIYINGTYYQMDVNVSLFGNSFQRNYSFIKNNTIPVGSFMQANMTVCIYPEWQTYSVNGLVVYTNNSMVSRVFVVNTNLSEVRKNVSLYLLSNQTADQVIIFVNDENGLPVENVKVDVQRYFVGNGSYISVAQILSDFEGKGTTYLRVNDLFYRFALSINGTLVTSIPPTVIICQSGTCPPYTITLPLDRAGQSHLIERFGQFSTICSFNNATNYLTCDVLDSSGLTTHANLTVENYGAIAWNQVCSNYCQSNVCTLVCLIPNGNTSMSRYTVYAYDSENEPVIAASGVLDYRVQLISWGTTGLYLGLIIVPTLFLLGRFNPVAAITMALIGLIAGAYTAMLPITVGSLVGLIAVAAIIIWKIKA